MQRIRLSRAAVTLLVFCALQAVAQMPPPKPAPELSKLDFLAGHWVTEGELKPGPTGQGGKVTAIDDTEWMEGKFFLVMHSKFSGVAGDLTGLAIYGYDKKQQLYTFNSYNSAGEADHYTGTVDGDTITWSGSIAFGPQSLKTRYVQTKLSPTAYTYKFEVSPDGTNWVLVMDGKAAKK